MLTAERAYVDEEEDFTHVEVTVKSLMSAKNCRAPQFTSRFVASLADTYVQGYVDLVMRVNHT